MKATIKEISAKNKALETYYT